MHKHDERYKMIIPNTTEENLATKLEASPVDDGNKASKAAASSSSSTPWLRLKDPRIVRVSRAFGGKDRHSKVCTIRGLRDRRVRLSVSTAIQLYDLQDRLGLNQPSKVVDWLLNVTKDEIDELPPLPIPAGSLGLNYQSMLGHNYSHGSAAQTNEFKINCNGIDWEASSCHESNRSKFGNNSKAVNKEAMDEGEESKQHRNGDLHQKQVAASNNTSSTRTHSSHPSSFSALLNNVSAPFGYHWEPSSNLPSSHHMGSHGFFTSQAEDLQNFNVLPLPSPLSLSTGSQIFVCPPGLTQSLEIDPRQVNHHLQMLSSSSQSFFLNNSLAPAALQSINQPAPAMRPFHFSMAPKFVSQEKNNGNRPNKNGDQFASE